MKGNGTLVELGPERETDVTIHILTPFATFVLPEVKRVIHDFTLCGAEISRHIRVAPHELCGSPVDAARNEIAENALNAAAEQPSHEHLFLWVDSDIMFQPCAVGKLWRELRRHPEIDLISGGYCFKESGEPILAGRDYVGRQILEGVDYERGDVVECWYPCMGFLLHRAGVLERVPRPWFECIPDVAPATDGMGGGEDNTFFKKVRAAGLRAWVHTGAEVTHIDRRTGEAFTPAPPPRLVEMQA